MKYPKQAKELVHLLQVDQKEWIDFARTDFKSNDGFDSKKEWIALKQRAHGRAERMLQILNEVKEPTLTNIGAEGAEAMFVLAQHDTLDTLKQVLAVFTRYYERQKEDTYYQVIPPMADRVLILERKAQKFGTIWLPGKNKIPFLPTVEDFEHINARRAEYDIGPLRWPKSLAIPQLKQTWLKKPLSELTMRDPTDEEYDNFI
jgi:hypothetical protein